MVWSDAAAQAARKQLQVLSGGSSDIFEHEPVPLSVFVTDRGYLNNPPLSEIQYDAVWHLQQIYLPETHHALVDRVPGWDMARFVNFAWIQWGKGAGKDSICRIANARWIYLLQCLKSPQDYFGLPQGDVIHTLNVAASATQATRAYFEPLRNMVRMSKCFKDMYETVQGEEPGRASIRFAKGLEMVSGHSRASTMEGLNLIGGIADEISEFKTEDEATSLSAVGRSSVGTYETILKMIRTSARTRFPSNFKLAAISYPRFKGDAIQQLCQRGRDDNERYGLTEAEWQEKGEPGRGPSRVYVSGPWATWDVNPRIDSKVDFQEDYDEDPAMAKAMYECDPGLATNRFFRNDLAVHAAFSERRSPIRIEYHWGKDDTPVGESALIPEERDGWQVRFHFDPDVVPMQGAMYCLHGDLGITGDRAGVAMAHVRQVKTAEWKTTADDLPEPRPLVRLDLVTAFEADLTTEPPREVQIRWFRKLVWELIAKGFVIVRVTADGFQSADMLQVLASRGIETKVVSMDRNNDGWNNLRDVMYDGRLEAYWDTLVVDELLSLMRLRNGKVDHPGGGGSKDCADAVAGAVLGAVTVGGSEGEDPSRVDAASEGSWSVPTRMGKGLAFGGEGEPAWGGTGSVAF